MPALNFNQRFAGLVESGAKTQTIRKLRKRPIKVGDRLYLYTGMRTKQCRKLGEGIVEHVWPILIERTPDPTEGAAQIMLDGQWLNRGQAAELARRDGFGFNGLGALSYWLDTTYGLPFDGVLIRWGQA